MDNKSIISRAAYKTLDLLHQRKAMLYPDGTVFWVWEREDRAIIVFDTAAIDLGKVNDDFAHRLSTLLNGRRVVRTNSRGMFLQIGYEIPPAAHELASLPLDLNNQPTPFDMPMGETARGAMWVSLTEGDSFLVAGTRGYGKSNLLQGWVQALLRGGKALIYAYDGKSGVEFSRYIGLPNFNYVSNLAVSLRELFAISAERRHILLKSGYQNIGSYNAAHPESVIQPVALFVDEAALASDEEREMLVKMVERERDTGFHPIYGTNRPEAAVLLVKSNLATRVCFAVPSWNASQMALGMNGAEKLERVPGRGLIVHRARLTKFQAALAKLPEPTAEATAFIDGLAVGSEPTATVVDTDTARILELDKAGKAESVIIRELWNITGGGSYHKRQTQVRAVLGQKVTSSTSSPILGVDMGLQAV